MIVTLGTTPALQRTMTFASLQIDAVNRAASVREHASGKGINVARVAHTLGKSCVATGFVGGDSGSFCRRDMDSAGIAHDFVTVASKTRMCATLIDQTNRTATELIEEAGPVTKSDVAKLLVKLELLLQHARVLVLSGTLAPGCGDDFYARCAKLAATAHVRVIVDARGAPLKVALAEKPFIIKPNRAELAATVEHPIESDQQLRDALRAIGTMGAGWTVVTNGPGETVASDGRSMWKLTTPKVAAVNPIGSGDSFAAGIAVGLIDELEVPQACALGVACGAANALTEFAAHLRIEDVERLKSQITIELLS
jgi:tagatose 6-phosphate kinase